ncbi:MAG: hypothetical protein K8T20_20905 [Planctomycetes bacterium]|nr:hypothetical protein [Planctomycetota bacterium]
MNRAAALLLGLLLALSAPAPAEDPKAPSLPQVRESDLADWDVASLSPGDWVEHELAGPGSPATAGNKRPARRLACVAVEEAVVWVEVTMKNAGPVWEGMVLSLGARKSDGKVTKAFWGKPSGEGRELTVGAAQAGPGIAPGTARPTVTAACKVTKEKMKGGSSTFDCEKVEIETQLTSSCCDEKRRTTSWVSEKVPFHARIEEKPRVNGLEAETTWDGKPSVKGGLVKRTVSENNTLEVMTLLRSGTDAKESLKRGK